MAILSDRTKTAVSGGYVREDQDYYPDRDASGHLIATSATVYRLNEDEIPTTTRDMSRKFKWEHGDELYGTFAKKESACMTSHIRDINRQYGREDDYKNIFIDTFSKDGIGKQLEKLK